MPLSLAQARHLALFGQGLLEPPRAPASVDSVANKVRALGFVQLDSINMVTRAHHLILGTRIDGYQPELLHRWVSQRGAFEGWTHDASVIPIESYPYWRFRRQRFTEGIKKNLWWQGRLGPNPDKTQKSIIERLTKEGPLPTRAFRIKKAERQSWWGWSPFKANLEHLWRSGHLAIAGRHNFEKIYDLTERVIPEELLQIKVERHEAIAWCCEQALQRLVFGSLSEIAHFWHFFTSKELHEHCAANFETCEFLGKEVYLHPQWKAFQQALTKPSSRLRLLCPFDPLIRDRKRLKSLFNFDYRFEAFVPASKRKYGYYVFPILQGDTLVGRTDLKFHRKEAVLAVQGLWWEPGQRPKLAALKEELWRWARRLGATALRLPEM